MSILIGLKAPVGCTVFVVTIRTTRRLPVGAHGLPQPKCQKIRRNPGTLWRKIPDGEPSADFAVERRLSFSPLQLRNTLIPSVFLLLAIFPLDNLKES
jgi:hypothetical protein